MRILVIYESMFGNTATVAAAVAAGLAPYGDVTAREVADAPTALDGVDLLVVGAPTHTFGLSRPQTRLDARRQSTAALVSTGRGAREWLDAVTGPTTVPVATFDTSVPRFTWMGTAAVKAARRLRARGHQLVARPEHFTVTGTTGPLGEREVDRARAWGATVGAAATARTTPAAG
jgi:hypothetical protein